MNSMVLSFDSVHEYARHEQATATLLIFKSYALRFESSNLSFAFYILFLTVFFLSVIYHIVSNYLKDGTDLSQNCAG